MQTITTVSTKAIRRPAFAVRRVSRGPRLLRRFRKFIESTDWDERYLGSCWIDRACLGVILLSVFYFIPVLAPVFLG